MISAPVPDQRLKRRQSPKVLAALSVRERQILCGITRRMTNKAIASELGISFRTVEIHRARLMLKLGAVSLADLLKIAAAAGRPHPDGARMEAAPAPASASIAETAVGEKGTARGDP
jgi:DNA-binding NarL/FixJ family response regulator